MSDTRSQPEPDPMATETMHDGAEEARDRLRRLQLRRPWPCSIYTLFITLVGFAAVFLMVQSFLTKQLDAKGCDMSYMRPMYSKYDKFDTEHTRFASKYSLYLYREWGIDEEFTVKGVPVLFIPGNAGSYKQVRSLASEAAYLYHNSVQHEAGAAAKRPLDFFSVDFNEDFTAFHGQTLLDQAEYLNDAIAYILSLYHTPGQVQRDPALPDPTSVIIVGHSMGGMVARTMVTMPNYLANSINTIVTLAAPHARAPLSFDGDIVRTYKGVNDYWRKSYAQKWAVDNPLWHVTLVSIAGGGLDTIVSSDYASIASLIPETHGFTVFTSSIPNCWTGADHLAITWCDQVRKSVVRALYDAIDVSRPGQTVALYDRMRSFKKRFLTGLEDIVEKTLPQQEAQILLTTEEHSVTSPRSVRLVLRNLGRSAQMPHAFLLKIPRDGTRETKFTLLTNENLVDEGEHNQLEVLFCSISAAHAKVATVYSKHINLSGDNAGATRLTCKSASSDVITLPESVEQYDLPFKPGQSPFSYLQYDLAELKEYDFVAVIDRADDQSTGWAIAEFAAADSDINADISLQRLLTSGVSLTLPARRSLMTEVKVPALHSSLLAYNLHVSRQDCAQGRMFAPLLRQYITDVYESKFFVNVEDAMINLHGVSPYLPPALRSKPMSNVLSLQLWLDPTCDSEVEVTLRVDVIGSLGKLWMRYRIVFAAFPLLVVALVLRQQFRTYDRTGVFMSFAQGLNECTHSSLPLALAALTFLSITLASTQLQTDKQQSSSGHPGNVTTFYDSANNELLLGSDDPFFWFLVPLFGIMCTAICVAINFIALFLTYTFASIYSLFKPSKLQSADGKRTPSTFAFAVNSPRQRVITTLILLSLISTVIPYHFAYAVLCLVQLATCVRALRLARDSQLEANYNFYNYAHSIFVLMLWILPINLPVLVVWVRNLMVHWLTPFSSHHNVLSIMPILLLVEAMSTGRMMPRTSGVVSVGTGVLCFGIGSYAAVYGVSYAYVLHYLANVLCAWLVAIYFDMANLSYGSIKRLGEVTGWRADEKKRP